MGYSIMLRSSVFLFLLVISRSAIVFGTAGGSNIAQASTGKSLTVDTPTGNQGGSHSNCSKGHSSSSHQVGSGANTGVVSDVYLL